MVNYAILTSKTHNLGPKNTKKHSFFIVFLPFFNKNYSF